jgi:hypothetical protein
MRILVVAGALTGAWLATRVGRPEPPDGGVAVATLPTAEELRSRYAGLYRYAGDAREQKAHDEAIDRSVETFFFALRAMARAKVAARTRIAPTYKLEFSGGAIRATIPGRAVAVSPENGTPAPYRVDDEPIVLSQRFEGAGLVQTFRSDDGARRNDLTLSPDGTVLTMKATLSSPKLSVPVTYTLTYRRAE